MPPRASRPTARSPATVPSPITSFSLLVQNPRAHDAAPHPFTRRGRPGSGKCDAVEGFAGHPRGRAVQAAVQIVVLGHRVAGVGHVAERLARHRTLAHLPVQRRFGKVAGIRPAGVEAAGDPHHYRHRIPLRSGKGRLHQAQAGARRIRLHHRQFQEVGERARVLVVLRAVGAGVVAEDDHQASAQRGQVQRHQRVHHHVHADALGAHQRAQAAETCADRHLQRDAFVGGPLQVAAGAGAGAAPLDQRRHGRRARRTGVAGNAADPGASGAVGQRLPSGKGARYVHDFQPPPLLNAYYTRTNRGRDGDLARAATAAKLRRCRNLRRSTGAFWDRAA